MGDWEIPNGTANYGDIPSGLYYNHIVVIHVDTEISTVLFEETFTQSRIVLFCLASILFSNDASDQTSLQSECVYLPVRLSSLSYPTLSKLS